MWPLISRGCLRYLISGVFISFLFPVLFSFIISSPTPPSLTSFYSFASTGVDLFDFARRPVKRCCTLMLMWTVRSLLHNVTASSRASLKCLELMGHFSRIHAPIPLQEMTLIFLSFTPSCIVLSGSQRVSMHELGRSALSACEQNHLCLYIEHNGGEMDFLSIFFAIYFKNINIFEVSAGTSRRIDLIMRRTCSLLSSLVELSSPASFYIFCVYPYATHCVWRHSELSKARIDWFAGWVSWRDGLILKRIKRQPLDIRGTVFLVKYFWWPRKN